MDSLESSHLKLWPPALSHWNGRWALLTDTESPHSRCQAHGLLHGRLSLLPTVCSFVLLKPRVGGPRASPRPSAFHTPPGPFTAAGSGVLAATSPPAACEWICRPWGADAFQAAGSCACSLLSGSQRGNAVSLKPGEPLSALGDLVPGAGFLPGWRSSAF